MEHFPQYAKYKSTSFPWLKEVPEHWSVKRIKNVATYNDDALDERTDSDLEIEYVDISSVTLTNGIEQSETMTFEKAPSRARRKVKHGDIIVSTVRTYLKAIAPIINPPGNMIVSTGFAVVRPMNDFQSGYAGYLLQSSGFVGEVVANSVGVSYPAINASDLVRIPAVEPPLSEQQAIARFLDYKTAQIDALIAKKQALLEKLAEKRTALISHAVTKGLDPSVPMKHSGVVWLGEIPAHWNAKRTKFNVSYIGSGKTPKGGSEVYVQEGIMILRSQNVHDAGLSLDDVAFITDEADAAQANSRVAAGDVLLNITGASIGRTSIVPSPFPQANVNQHVCILRPITECISSAYLHFLLCSRQAKDQISSSENGTSREGLNFPQVGGLLFAFPPVPEQLRIVEFLKAEIDALDKQGSKVVAVIQRLKEYRSALITNTVTGKIDVRNFKIPLSAKEPDHA